MGGFCVLAKEAEVESGRGESNQVAVVSGCLGVWAQAEIRDTAHVICVCVANPGRDRPGSVGFPMWVLFCLWSVVEVRALC